MSVLVDTNILLRRVQPDHVHHAPAIESVARLLAAGEQVYFTLQNIAEFWNVMTRPIAANGLGFSPAFTLSELVKIERVLTRLPDSPATYEEWKRLVITYAVGGAKVHDARLVAIMNVHGVRRILTFNIADFARFKIEALTHRRCWLSVLAHASSWSLEHFPKRLRKRKMQDRIDRLPSKQPGPQRLSRGKPARGAKRP
jgi:predicted nucleic acid-binding protein